MIPTFHMIEKYLDLKQNKISKFKIECFINHKRVFKSDNLAFTFFSDLIFKVGG